MRPPVIVSSRADIESVALTPGATTSLCCSRVGSVAYPRNETTVLRGHEDLRGVEGHTVARSSAVAPARRQPELGEHVPVLRDATQELDRTHVILLEERSIV